MSRKVPSSFSLIGFPLLPSFAYSHLSSCIRVIHTLINGSYPSSNYVDISIFFSSSTSLRRQRQILCIFPSFPYLLLLSLPFTLSLSGFNSSKGQWKSQCWGEPTMNPQFFNYSIGEFKYLRGVKPTPKKELRGVPLNVSLPVNDLLACCGWKCGDGCDGGHEIDAWRYFVQSGITEEFRLLNEKLRGKSHLDHAQSVPQSRYPTPTCERKCADKNKRWAESKHFVVNAYRIDSDRHSIMAEVSRNGPVEVSVTVYEDFAHYKSEGYMHITGEVVGRRAVKLIGWGTSDAEEDYWDGYFKNKRRTTECGLEEDVFAGLRSTRNLVREVVSIDAMPMSMLLLDNGLSNSDAM
ncbi:unnamed protein product [Dovyalis caffra]|uniref:Peptidase C1A papain C-terminal domain-containing protein n=1 Tax=Dovyalis caffra TaxID=77055 RepID=A0AAV1SAW9_9ROSI|nr:unnamed protein product [Dovyalis caffra]